MRDVSSHPGSEDFAQAHGERFLWEEARGSGAAQPGAPQVRESPGSPRVSRLPGPSASLRAPGPASARGLGAAQALVRRCLRPGVREEEGGSTPAPRSPRNLWVPRMSVCLGGGLHQPAQETGGRAAVRARV